MQQYNKVVLSLGSNLGDKKAFLLQAIQQIHDHIGFVKQASFIYETPSWGFDSFPFYNICILLNTHLQPEVLLDKLKDLEKKLGRTIKTTESYSARTVDIDIVYFNDEVIETEYLTIPHPQMQNRTFVLIPLNDLEIEWKHPVLQKDTSELLSNCNDDSEIKKVEAIQLPKDKYSIQKLNFIAIEGNIGSGKTTLVQKMTQDFNAKSILERFAENPFLPKFYQNPERYAFPLEMSFLADRYLQLSEDLGQYDLFKEFVIADYYIYKSLIFAQVTLDLEEVNLYRNVFDVMYKETQKTDLYIYLYQKTDNLLENIKKRGRNYESDIEAEYLDKINHSYSEFIKTLPQENVLIIDVSAKDFVEKQEDYLDVLNIINSKILSVSDR